MLEPDAWQIKCPLSSSIEQLVTDLVWRKADPPNLPGSSYSPSRSRLGGNVLFAQFRRHIVGAFPGLTPFDETQPGIE